MSLLGGSVVPGLSGTIIRLLPLAPIRSGIKLALRPFWLCHLQYTRVHALGLPSHTLAGRDLARHLGVPSGSHILLGEEGKTQSYAAFVIHLHLYELSENFMGTKSALLAI